MSTTTNRGYFYPASTANVQIWKHLQDLAEDVDADVQALLTGKIQNHLDEDEQIADSATWTTTETAALYTVTANLTSGESYWLELFTNVSSSVSGTELSLMRFREDSGTAAGGTQFASALAYIPTSSGNGYPLWIKAKYTAVATGSKTLVVTGQRISGTGNHQTRSGASRKTIFTLDRIV